MSKKSYSLIFLIIAFSLSPIFCETSVEKGSGYSLSVKGSAKQGGFIYIKLSGSKADDEAECVFRKKNYPLIWQKDALGAILPVALDTSPGNHNLKVNIKGKDTNPDISIERVIPVKPCSYGVQHLWLSEEQLSRYDNPQSDKDNDEIHMALSKYTEGIIWSRSFIWPVNSYISTQFGLKRFYNNDAEPEYHRGMDIPGGTGTPVLAAQSGIVRFAKKNLLLHGTAIVLDHGKGIGTLYIHLSSLNVKTGDSVNQGDVIGAVGATGVATGPHLHWAAYVHDEPVDPKLLFHIPQDWLDN